MITADNRFIDPDCTASLALAFVGLALNLHPLELIHKILDQSFNMGLLISRDTKIRQRESRNISRWTQTALTPSPVLWFLSDERRMMLLIFINPDGISDEDKAQNQIMN